MPAMQSPSSLAEDFLRYNVSDRWLQALSTGEQEGSKTLDERAVHSIVPTRHQRPLFVTMSVFEQNML